MHDPEVSGAKVLHLPIKPATEHASNDVLRTLLQTLRDADPIPDAGGAGASPVASEHSVDALQLARGVGNVQMQQRDALRQEVDGSNNFQLAGLNVVVRVDAPCRPSILASVNVSKVWRFIAYALVVVVAFLV